MKYEDWIKYERGRLFAKKRIGVMPTYAEVARLTRPKAPPRQPYFPIVNHRQFFSNPGRRIRAEVLNPYLGRDGYGVRPS